MPRFSFLGFLLSVFCGVCSLLNAQERPSVSFAPTEVQRVRDAFQVPAAQPRTDIAQPIQQAVALTMPTKPQIETPQEKANLPAGIEEKEKAEKNTEESGILDKPLSLDGKSEKTGKKLSRPALTDSIAPLVSVVGSLLIVLSAFFILVYLMKKVSPKGVRNLPKDVFENLGRTQLTQKIQLNLLRLGNRLLLVSVTADGVQALTEVTEPDEVVPLLGLCRQLDKNSSTEVFRQALAKFSTDESEEKESPKSRRDEMSGGRSPLSPHSTKPALVDLYSDPDASLAEILAKGLGRG